MGEKKRRSLDSLAPEGRAKVEALMARWHTPEARSSEREARAALTAEYRETGAIEASDNPDNLPGSLDARRLLTEIRTYREAIGLSLATVSEQSGIDLPALSQLEMTRPEHSMSGEPMTDAQAAAVLKELRTIRVCLIILTAIIAVASAKATFNL